MKIFFSFLIILLLPFSLCAQVGIGNINPQGALDITSSDNGLLIPRIALLNTSDVTTVITGTESELVYNTTLASGTTDVRPGFYYLSAPGGPWVRLGDASSPPPPPPVPVDSWLTAGNDNIVEGVNFLGTVTGTNVDVAFRRNGIESGRISANLTSFGMSAGLANVSTQNTYIGFNSGATSSNGSSDKNVAVGHSALVGSADLASNNVAIGQNALVGGSGSSNTAVGQNAGGSCNGCNNNVMIGRNASTVNGQGNVMIGVGAIINGNFSSNSIAIGNGAIFNSSNRIQIGSGTTQTAFVNAPSWTYTSDRRLKADIKDSQLGLDFLKTIRPVSYYRKDDVDHKTEFGFIAQELDEALKTAGITNTAIIDKTSDNMFAVRYNDFLPMTVKAVQEQQVLIEKLQKDNEELIAVNTAILKRLEALENK